MQTSGALGGWQQLSHGTWSLRSVASKVRWRRLWHGSGCSPAKGCGRSLSLTRTAAPIQLHTCVGLCKPARPAANETTPGRRGRRQGLQCEPGACPWAGSHIGPADTARRRRGCQKRRQRQLSGAPSASLTRSGSCQTCPPLARPCLVLKLASPSRDSAARLRAAGVLPASEVPGLCLGCRRDAGEPSSPGASPFCEATGSGHLCPAPRRYGPGV